jgi:hypothetical protein
VINVTTVGIDLAKNVFSVHGVDSGGKVLVRRTIGRSISAHEAVLTLPRRTVRRSFPFGKDSLKSMPISGVYGTPLSHKSVDRQIGSRFSNDFQTSRRDRARANAIGNRVNY